MSDLTGAQRGAPNPRRRERRRARPAAATSRPGRSWPSWCSPRRHRHGRAVPVDARDHLDAAPTEAYDLPPTWLPDRVPVGELLRRRHRPGAAAAEHVQQRVHRHPQRPWAMLITAPMAGYAFAQLRFPAANALFMLLLASLMVPVQVTDHPAVPDDAQPADSSTPRWSLILPGITGAFGVFLMRQFFLGLPESSSRRPRSTAPAPGPPTGWSRCPWPQRPERAGDHRRS